MEPTRKVLIVDKTIDRKRRIAAIKERGFSVFPALQLADARSRCRPGAYDLIVVNAPDEPDAAMALCDLVCQRNPRQLVLLTVADGGPRPERDYIVDDDPKVLADRVEAALRGSSKATESEAKAAETGAAGKQEDLPERASA